MRRLVLIRLEEGHLPQPQTLGLAPRATPADAATPLAPDPAVWRGWRRCRGVEEWDGETPGTNTLRIIRGPAARRQRGGRAADTVLRAVGATASALAVSNFSTKG